MKNLRHLLRRVRPSQSRRASESVRSSEGRSRGPRQSKRRLLTETLESRQLLAGDFGGTMGDAPFEVPADTYEDVDNYSVGHNYWNKFDVDNNGQITALDALRVINHMNSHAEGEMTGDQVASSGFVDVNEDHVVTALDALLVINQLNASGPEAEDNFTVGFQISPRNLDDTLLTSTGTYTTAVGTSPIYSINQGDVFKIEVAAQDNRNAFTASGVFQSVVDILVSQSGVLVPAVGEIQGADIPDSLLSQTGQVELFYADDEGSALTFSLADFFNDTQQIVTDSVIQLNPLVDQDSDIFVTVGSSVGDSTVNFRVNYDALDLANVPIPTLVTRITVGGVSQTIGIFEQNLTLSDGSFNPAVLVSRYETFTRNAPSNIPPQPGVPQAERKFFTGPGITKGDLVYGQNRNIGSFDVNVGGNGIDIFDEVGTLGPVGDLKSILSPFSNQVAYDTFSIPVMAVTAASNVTVRAEAAAPRDAQNGGSTFEGVLIYGTAGGKEQVPIEQIMFGEKAQFRLNVSGTQTGITAQNASLTVDEDDTVGKTVQLVVTPSTTTETVTYAVQANRPGALGTATISSTGLLTYIPNANQFGTDTITYTASTPTDGTATATVTVTVNNLNDVPTAVDDVVVPNAVVGGTPLLINVLANDSAGGGNEPLSELTITLVSPAPTRGTVSVVNDGTNGPRVRYTPNAGASTGSDTFRYRITDTGGLFAEANVTLNVVNNSTGVTAADLTIAAINEDSAEILAADLSVDNLVSVNTGGTTITLVSATVPAAQGTTRIDGDQIFFTPALNFNGNALITYTASNSEGSDTGVITVPVTAVNDSPTAPTLDFTLNERSSRLLNILQPGAGNTAPSDVEDNDSTLTIELPVQSFDSRGTVVLEGNQIRVTSVAAASAGDFSFQYRVRDSNGGTTVGVVNMDVVDVLDPPVANDSTLTGNEDGPNLMVDLTTLTTLEGGDNATFTIDSNSNAALGTAAIVGNNLVFTPKANANGVTSIVYRATGGNGFDTGTITVTLAPANDAPTIPAVIARTVLEDGQIDIDVVALASDIDGGDTLTAAVATNPTNGTATRLTSGLIRYKPNANFNGADSFTVTVSDGQGGTATSTVNITVTDVVAAPIAGDGTLAATEDGGPVTRSLVSLVTLDPGDTATFALVSGAANGTATVSAAGVLTYTPNANFNGTNSITYRATNASGSDTGIITVSVASVNDAPIANDDTATTVRNNSVQISVLANDNIDPANEGQAVTVTVAQANRPTNGTVSITNNVVTYTPNLDFSGTDSFTYTIDDGAGGTDTAVVTVTVNDFETSTIEGQIFQDSIVNINDVILKNATPIRNGIRDADEIALGGIRVRLESMASENVLGQDIVRTAITDVNGNYAFADVPPGQYRISFELAPGMVVTGEGEGGFIPVTVVGGADGTANAIVDASFTISKLGSLVGFGYNVLSTQPGMETLPDNVTPDEKSSFFFTRNETGQLAQGAYLVGPGFEGVRNVELSLNNARDRALLTIVNASDNSIRTAVVDADQLRMTANGTQVQLFGGLDDFTFVENVNDIVNDFPTYRDAIDEILSNL